jgi:hypothetical protein
MMTTPASDAPRGPILTPSILRFYPLAALLLLAAAIRLPLAFWPNILHPDEVFQTIEPAWRVLGRDGIVAWEWHYGMRGWLLPSLLAAPIGLGDWLAPGGTGAYVAPRLVAALASLSIVASAWALGARISRTHAFIAAFVAAIWFELVAFAPHTLSEPLATAAILPAAVLLTGASLSRTDLATGGALLALAVVLRFQYAPATAVLALGACWRHWRHLIPLLAGGAVGLMAGAIADAAQGAVPFAWVIANIQQNLLHDRAAEFGVTPATTYLYNFWTMWLAACGLLLLAIWQGRRHAPLLLAMAVVDLAFHSLIGHKEYRFIFLSVAIFVIIAALGSADWVIRWMRPTQVRPSWRTKFWPQTSWTLPVAAAGWTLVSAALAATGTMPANWMSGTQAAQLSLQLRDDPALCGLALYDVPFVVLPGHDRLVGRSPIYAFRPDDPAARSDITAMTRQAAPAFNRILSRRDTAGALPAGFARRDCASIEGDETCIFARGGSCDAAAATPFVLNDVLSRVGIRGSQVLRPSASHRPAG